MGRSTLFAVRPNGMRVDPAKFQDFRAKLESFWGTIDFDNHDQLVSEMFESILDDCKLYSYLTHKHTLMIEKLFHNIMEQNPEVPEMAWHFEWGDFPYCISIKREDMSKRYAVQLTLGIEDMAYYYDPPAEVGKCPQLNRERYLAVYPKHMKETNQLVSPDNAVQHIF